MDSRHFIDKLASTPLSQIVLLGVVFTLLRVAIYLLTKHVPPHKRTGKFSLYRMLDSASDSLVYAAIFVFMVIRPFAVQAYVIPSGSMWPTLKVGDFIAVNKAVYRYSDPKEGDIVVFRPPVDAAQRPTDLDPDGEINLTLVKRCIGVPGDMVELKDGVLFRNGQKIDEPYVHLSRCINKQEECVDFIDYTPDEVRNHTVQNFKLIDFLGQVMPLNYTTFDANQRLPLAAEPVLEVDQMPYNCAPKYEIGSPTDQRRAESLKAQPVPKGYYLMMGDNRNNSYDGRAWGLVPRDRIIGRAEFTWMPVSHWGRTH